MGSREEGAEGVADGGAEGRAVGGVFDYRAGCGCVSEGFWRKWDRSIEGEEGGIVLYRSMMVMRGETSPEAQAAAVISETNRHGKLLVFQS